MYYISILIFILYHIFYWFIFIFSYCIPKASKLICCKCSLSLFQELSLHPLKKEVICVLHLRKTEITSRSRAIKTNYLKPNEVQL